MMEEVLMFSREELVEAFDAWMDDAVNRPEEFEAELITMGQHVSERSAGEAATYGRRAAAMLEHYL